MAACTFQVATNDSTNTTSYLSTAFTPAANDLIVVFVSAAGTVAVGTMSDSQGLGFTKITSALKSASGDTLYLFVANALAAASSMTVTFDCTGDAATGATSVVYSVSGMSRTGADAVLQSAKEDNQASGGTPGPAFASACQTDNPTLGAVFNSAGFPILPAPTGWTEDADTGFTVPTQSIETVHRDSGFTDTTITWGSTSGSAFGDIIVELDSSTIPGPTSNESISIPFTGGSGPAGPF
jgi:hypothetical protein